MGMRLCDGRTMEEPYMKNRAVNKRSHVVDTPQASHNCARASSEEGAIETTPRLYSKTSGWVMCGVAGRQHDKRRISKFRAGMDRCGGK